MTRFHTPTLLQYDSAECGAVALGIVLAYYGCHVPLEELRTACGVSRDGSNALNLIRAAQRYGLEATGVRRNTLAALTAIGAPVILHWNLNHFVVFEGASKAEVFINDPAIGPRTISPAAFNQAFTGVVITAKPGSGFVPRGVPFRVGESLRALARGSEGNLLWIGLLGLLLLIPGFVLPTLLRIFIDSVIADGQRDPLNGLLIGLLAVLLTRLILTWAQQSALLRLDYKLTVESSSTFFRHLLRLPINFFAQRLGGDLVARVQLNQRVAHLLAGDVASAAINALLISFYAVLMAQYDLPLTLLTVGFGLIDLLVLRYAARYRRDANARLLQEQGKRSGLSTNGVQAIESLKAGGMEGAFFARWSGVQARVVNAQQDLLRIAFLTNAIPYFLTLLDTALILLIGAERVMAGGLSAGVVVAFQSVALSFLLPIGQIIGFGTQVQEIEGSLSRLHDVLAHPAINAETPSAESIPSTPTDTDMRLSVRDLSFGYSPLDPPLIESIGFDLAPGESIALVGASGSGKSTVAALIGGLYTPWQGTIRFGDRHPEAMAMVDQHIVLFGGTVRDNLTLWDAAIPIEQVIAAARDAAIHDTIMARPGGYDALIDEGGANFSGGERQRLEIARALVRNPTLLILDEATSALDVDTEARVIGNLWQRGCACLMIAHRPSAIQQCDRVLWLDGGRIVWQGDYPAYAAQSRDPQPDDHVSIEQATRQPIAQPGDFAAIDAESTQTVTLDEIAAFRARTLFDNRLVQALIRILPAIDPTAESARANPDPDALRSHLAATPHTANLIGSVASRFGLRTRRLRLDGDWWRGSRDPLLGYRSDDQQPVALIARHSGQYAVFDPGSDSARHYRLNRATAPQVMPWAWQFYAPLPEPKVTDSYRPLRLIDLLGYVRRTVQSDGLIAVGLVILLGAVSLIPPLVTSAIFDQVIPDGASGALIVLGGVLIASAIGAAALNLTAALVVTRIQARLDSTLPGAIWDRLLRLPIRFFRRYAVGDLVERALGIGQIQTALADVAAYVLVGGLLVAFNAALLIAYNPPLAVIMILLVIGYLAVGFGLGRRQTHFQRLALDLNGAQRSFALQILSGIRKLRASGAESRAFDRWQARFRREQDAGYRARQWQAIVLTFNASYPILITIALFALVADRSNLSEGQFIAFNAALAQLLIAAGQFGQAAARIQQSALPPLDRLRPLLAMAPEVRHVDRPAPILSGALRLDRLTFRYDDRSPNVIEDLSLTVAPGELIGIISPSGSGKSTLIRLLLGFETPVSGVVYYDDQPLAGLDLEALRAQIGVVLQNGALITGDLYTNIVGSRDLTMADAWRSARLAAIAPDIQRMPLGMNTTITEGQTSLSGGQIQRLLIARALANRPKIIFFDEATSALDEPTQRQIMDHLRQLRITCVVIAHRLSTLSAADRVYALENGRLHEIEDLKTAG